VAVVVSLREAVAELVHDSDSVALEGFTHLIPFGAGHEVVRQRRRGLTLIRMTPDLIYDQMIGMGWASRLVFSWEGIRVSVPCTASAMLSRMIGRRRSRLKNTVTPIWRHGIKPVHPDCLLP